jgi:hypothetical protein
MVTVPVPTLKSKVPPLIAKVEVVLIVRAPLLLMVPVYTALIEIVLTFTFVPITQFTVEVPSNITSSVPSAEGAEPPQFPPLLQLVFPTDCQIFVAALEVKIENNIIEIMYRFFIFKIEILELESNIINYRHCFAFIPK